MNKLLIVLLFAIVAIASAKFVKPSEQAFEFATRVQFAAFQLKFNKKYKSDDEEFMRYRIFKQNLKRIAKLNKKSEGRNNFGITKFADLTPSEFSHLYLMPKRPKPIIRDDQVLKMNKSIAGLPAAWDWRTDGLVNGVSAVTPVYNQGQCGSCWAFSATEEIESMTFLQGTARNGAQPYHLSMQQIVSCDNQAYGCEGGWTYVAYEYVESAGGLETGSEYPYTATNGYCNFKKSDVVADISSWKYVTQDEDEQTMKNFVGTTGPLSICVDASSWQFYQGGVLKNCGTQIDHCVQITGYSQVDGVEAWHVRNSWGTDWGVSGYIYLEYGQDTCACAQVVTTVTGTRVN